MYINSYREKTAQVFRLVCGFLFVLFSFLYLYLFQADLLALTQRVLSQGQTAYAPLGGAVLITLFLLLVQILISRWLVFPLRFQALSFFPSCMLLALCTDIHLEAFDEATDGWGWYLYLLIALLYIGIVKVVRLFPDVSSDKVSVYAYLWPNILILSLSFLLVGAGGNARDAFHYELRMARLLGQGKSEEALQVGIRSEVASRGLTAARAYALSLNGMLGDKLFEYPQRYGSNGLLPLETDSLFPGNWPQSLYRHLGGRPGKKQPGNVTAFLERLNGHERRTAAARDYLLCAYLLDKELDKFVQTLSDSCLFNDSLPRYYKEALVLYAHLRMKPVVVFHEGAVAANYEGFQECRSRYAVEEERNNRCRDMYGQTYWYYYYFQPVSLP